jgi:tripartite-type tricarboxylate transporter receptor subunit TctC
VGRRESHAPALSLKRNTGNRAGGSHNALPRRTRRKSLKCIRQRGSLARALVSAAFFSMCLAVGVSHAQPYPSKPIRIVVPFAAGSATDILARVVAQKMNESLGTTIVENRAGANGIIATEYVAKAAPDGYTIELGISGTHGSNAALYSRLPYDPVKQFEPITLAGQVPFALFASNAFPAKSVKEMVSLAKASPGKYNIGTTSAGLQLTAELLKIAAGINLTLVPYKSQSNALADLGSGNVDMLLYAVSAALGQVKAGQFRALAVTSGERSRLVPDLPTFAESGFPELNVTAWFAFYAPAGTPKEVVSKLHDSISKALKAPDVQKQLLDIGVEVVGSTPEELGKVTQNEIDKWKRIVREAKIPPVDAK